MRSTQGSAQFELARCRTRLRAYLQEIDALVDLVGDALVLFPPERNRAEAMYRKLKGGLRDELRAKRRRGASAAVSPVRVEPFDQSVRAALSRLTWPLHSIPGRRWLATLEDARVDLELGLLRMERRLRIFSERPR